MEAEGCRERIARSKGRGTLARDKGTRVRKSNDRERPAQKTRNARTLPRALCRLCIVICWRHGHRWQGQAYASRLLSCIATDSDSLRSRAWTLPKVGPVDDVLDMVPTWHGLTLARRILAMTCHIPSLLTRPSRNCNRVSKALFPRSKRTAPTRGATIIRRTARGKIAFGRKCTSTFRHSRNRPPLATFRLEPSVCATRREIGPCTPERTKTG